MLHKCCIKARKKRLGVNPFCQNKKYCGNVDKSLEKGNIIHQIRPYRKNRWILG